ncbi:unnamed protein product [Phyllotreta striolata]|uniref:C2H2-type domain-containing protein n=1 Tax=Phyllotreta striolata TaxID=444603 RepID=A0A9N9XQU0_PHYSR|nr:unnamed protein product [Phyllotreta striolata]
MWVDNYRWHYDYTRLAWDTGFCFDKFKYPNLDKNKICLIDIDRIIKERDVASVDRNISTVVQYVLENDQAEVLDVNFVKVFRLSQLSVEYLLFCKKYLDKTVVLLKKELNKLKEEIKELKIQKELESHISSSSSRNTPLTTLKCAICSKIVSSEDHLTSHINKRHNGGLHNKFGVNSEAEKLQSEIKELKERLNNTEKFIQEKPTEKEIDIYQSPLRVVHKDNDDRTTKLVGEIQDSFEKFRRQVEDKMSNLQTEKSFFTEKYDKLFEIVLQFKNKEQEPVKAEESTPKKSAIEQPKIENTTQTSEQEDKRQKAKNFQVYTVHHDVIGSKPEQLDEAVATEEKIDEKIERKLSNFEETIETKISTGFGNIENQIQAFWEKLSEVEIAHSKIGDHGFEATIQAIPLERFPEKPKIKPRTKLTKQTSNSPENSSRNAKMVKQELDKFLAENVESQSPSPSEEVKSPVKFESKPTVVKSAVSNMYESTTEDDISDEEEFEESVVSEYDNLSKPSNVVTLVKQKDSLSRSGNKSVEDKNLATSTISKIRQVKSSILKRTPLAKTVKKDDTVKEIEKLKTKLNESISLGLQEMGISPLWKGIPKKTFERGMEVVKHQSFLSKKNHPNYDALRQDIEKSLKSSKEIKKTRKKRQYLPSNKSPHKSKEAKRNVVKLQIHKSDPLESESKPDSAITIKNRSLYDTESETDMKSYLPKNFDQKKVHNAVIEELQSKFSSNKSQNTDSDVNSAGLPSDKDDKKEQNVLETKSSIKTAAAEGTHVKKKVLFDVEEHKEEKSTVKDDSFSDFELSD